MEILIEAPGVDKTPGISLSSTGCGLLIIKSSFSMTGDDYGNAAEGESLLPNSRILYPQFLEPVYPSLMGIYRAFLPIR
jgi:hypothetical protein